MTIIDTMQQKAAEAFRDGRVAELPQEWLLAMIARNRIRFHGEMPEVASVKDIPSGVSMKRACIFGGCDDGDFI